MVAAYAAAVDRSPKPQPHAPAVAASGISTDAVKNRANDWLLAHNGHDRAERLGRTVGDGCKALVTFYQGTAKSKLQSADLHPQAPALLPGMENDAFWNVSCADGRTVVVELHPDGSGKIIDCPVLKSLHAGECFKRY